MPLREKTSQSLLNTVNTVFIVVGTIAAGVEINFSKSEQSYETI